MRPYGRCRRPFFVKGLSRGLGVTSPGLPKRGGRCFCSDAAVASGTMLGRARVAKVSAPGSHLGVHLGAVLVHFGSILGIGGPKWRQVPDRGPQVPDRGPQVPDRWAQVLKNMRFWQHFGAHFESLFPHFFGFLVVVLATCFRFGF